MHRVWIVIESWQEGSQIHGVFKRAKEADALIKELRKELGYYCNLERIVYEVQ